jgi:ketosteroid isomerase-like protein
MERSGKIYNAGRWFPALIAAAVLCASCVPEPDAPDAARPPTPAPGAEADAIRALLNRQVEDWNAGDIEAFMEGYWQSDSLRFVSGGTLRRGWQTTIERYFAAYPDRDAMGTLAFDELDIRLPAPRWALVAGTWHLRRGGAYDDIGGRFTLVLEKRPEGWRIVYDHTSSDA